MLSPLLTSFQSSIDMPRTIWNHDRLGSDSDSDVRNDAEQVHWSQQERSFRDPLYVYPPQLHWLPRSTTKWAKKPIEELVPEDCRRFCFKDCAVYAVCQGGTNKWWRQQLHDKIYRYWFPSRSEDTDISHGSFFCNYLEFAKNFKSTTPPSVKEVLDFHSKLCEKLHTSIPSLAKDVPLRPYTTVEGSMLLPATVYKLRPTFKECFIVIEAEYGDHSIDGPPTKDKGVILVWENEEKANRHGCMVDREQGISKEDCGDLGQARAFRCSSLEQAMELVLSTEPGRGFTKRERHGQYISEGIEVLDQANMPPVELCRCSLCRPELYKPLNQM